MLIYKEFLKMYSSKELKFNIKTMKMGCLFENELKTKRKTASEQSFVSQFYH